MPQHNGIFVWRGVVAGSIAGLYVLFVLTLYCVSKVPVAEPCKCALPVPCSCPEPQPCTCDHAALLKQAADLKHRDGELQIGINQVAEAIRANQIADRTLVHPKIEKQGEAIKALEAAIEALEDRASDGESKVLKGYKEILEERQRVRARLDKLEGRKPPVRRQASCGAHPPSCEGIAALGADGEPDGVTGVLFCAWEPGDIWRCYQEWRAKDAKERLERAKRRQALRELFFGVS